jgi:hypothetical protein
MIQAARFHSVGMMAALADANVGEGILDGKN